MTEGTESSYAQMQTRNSNEVSPEYYATPKWLVRAAVEALHAKGIGLGRIWEPACGDGSIVQALQEYGYEVAMSDKYASRDYGLDPAYDMDFIDPAAPVGENLFDTVFTNPPYGKGEYAVEGRKTPLKVARPEAFIEAGLRAASGVVCLLLRSNMIAGQDRVDDIYLQTPPAYIIQSASRPNINKGPAKKKGGGMIDFTWFVWVDRTRYAGIVHPEGTQVIWLHSSTRERLEREDDYLPPTPEELAAEEAKKAEKKAKDAARRAKRAAAKALAEGKKVDHVDGDGVITEIPATEPCAGCGKQTIHFTHPEARDRADDVLQGTDCAACVAAIEAST